MVALVGTKRYGPLSNSATEYFCDFAEYFCSEPRNLPWRNAESTEGGSIRPLLLMPLPPVARTARRCTSCSTTSLVLISIVAASAAGPPFSKTPFGICFAPAQTRYSLVTCRTTLPFASRVTAPGLAQSWARISGVHTAW